MGRRVSGAKQPEDKKSNQLLNMLDGLYEAGLPNQELKTPEPELRKPSPLPSPPTDTAGLLQQLQALPLPGRKPEEDEELEEETALPPVPVTAGGK